MVPSYVMTVRLLSRRAKFVRNNSLSMTSNQQQQQQQPTSSDRFLATNGSSSRKTTDELEAKQQLSGRVDKFIDDDYQGQDHADPRAEAVLQQHDARDLESSLIPTVRILTIENEPRDFHCR